MTQLEYAKKGIITEEMRRVAADEKVTVEFIISKMAAGEIVITKNKNHSKVKPTGIGAGLKTKVNANIGSSQDVCDIKMELEKLELCVKHGADAVMDLSTGGDIREIRKKIVEASPVPIGTVPIYQTMVDIKRDGRGLKEMTGDDLFKTIEEHGEQGVDFITVHCGITKNTVNELLQQGRLLNIVSRGGSMHAAWILNNEKENPLFEQYDRLLDIAYKYDMTLSLGDGMRPGCLSDATDRAQIHELISLGALAKRAYDKNVQVMIEGPGHMPLNQIAMNMQIQKKLCNNAPFYDLGPLVTDIAPGYDHITAAIGGALAAASGADFLCYVTAAEHLKLPGAEEVKEGVIVSRIAAHAADIAKGIPGAIEWDNKMAEARKKLDWDAQIKLAINPERAKKMRESSRPAAEDVCTMCGELCAIKEMNTALQNRVLDNHKKK
ncbi:MAG TPA: phosphomethylpyrimidine synthase ThiC [Candidatus Goldiibacteriota bacterium]|nr:phosphomethylpyrimidine synthase ThiC [Candidatus Goldiibacteriota bacterium]